LNFNLSCNWQIDKMRAPDLHIITFGVPYPAQYGGAIDSWNRILALHQLGLNLHIHCFLYGDFRPDPALREVAGEVHYYPRVVWPALFSKGQPYIVTSRKSQALLKRLNADRSPILFEGIHTTGFIAQLRDRILLLRAHNVEQHYYAELALQSSGLKSMLFQRESLCLSEYESNTAKAVKVVFAISPSDQDWFAHQGATSVFIPPFHGSQEVAIQTGRGGYLLYQGDLSLEINQNALLDLLFRLPMDAAYPVIAAGRSGDKTFEDKLATFPNLSREANVSQEKMIDLIQRAQVILIHSLHGSGMKLKIFPALYHGKFIAATANCMTHTDLDQAIHFYDNASLSDTLTLLWSSEFTDARLNQRKEILAHHPSDLDKAKEIIRYL